MASSKSSSTASVPTQIKAVVLGLVVDLGGNALLNVLVFGFFSLHFLPRLSADLSGAEIETGLANMSALPWLSIAIAVVGLALSALGGYVCARKSKRSDFKLGLVLAALSCFMTVVFSEHALSEEALDLALTFAFILLGTKLGQPKKDYRAFSETKLSQF